MTPAGPSCFCGLCLFCVSVGSAADHQYDWRHLGLVFSHYKIPPFLRLGEFISPAQCFIVLSQATRNTIHSIHPCKHFSVLTFTSHGVIFSFSTIGVYLLVKINFLLIGLIPVPCVAVMVFEPNSDKNGGSSIY